MHAKTSTGLSAMILLAVLATASARPASAQGRTGGSGPTPLGREGAIWQTDQALSLEAMKEFNAGLAGLSDDEWREQAIAWLRLDIDEEGGEEWQVRIEGAHRVGSVDAGKKTQVDTGPGGLLPWIVSGSKKLPRSLSVILTDVDSTEVKCLLRGEAPQGAANLGVFVLEGQLVCAYRGAGDPS